MRRRDLGALVAIALCAAAFLPEAGTVARATGEAQPLAQRGPGGGFGRGMGPGMGDPNQAEVKLVAEFDRNGNGRLDRDERQAALGRAENQSLARGGRGGRAGSWPQPEPGPRLSPDEVRAFPATVPFYDAGTLRTLFLTFEDANWEQQLMAFKTTDVRVPATLVVDGKAYREVGVQFHGNTSFSQVPAGYKHSMNIEIDFVDKDQRLAGHQELLLLNAHTDPSYLRSVVAMDIARAYLPAPRANFVRVAINGENWGIYPSIEHFDRTFVRARFPDGDHDDARWKVTGSPRGGGGLEYLGEDVALYRSRFDIKTDDEPDAWVALASLTRVLNQTPVDAREAELRRVLDVDGAIDFIAVDNALVNNDGYWVRASDYNLYLDRAGRFHVIPYDANETFPASGGGGRGMRGGGPNLDPFVGLADSSKPLRSRLLEVPALRARYVRTLRDIATNWLAWDKLGPLVARYHDLIRGDVRVETRGVESFAAFENSAARLREFAETRRMFLLEAAR